MTNRQMAALKWAVGRAEEWRGSLVGNPDSAPLEAFDNTVRLAKEALEEVRAMRRAARKAVLSRFIP